MRFSKISIEEIIILHTYSFFFKIFYIAFNWLGTHFATHIKLDPNIIHVCSYNWARAWTLMSNLTLNSPSRSHPRIPSIWLKSFSCNGITNSFIHPSIHYFPLSPAFFSINTSCSTLRCMPTLLTPKINCTWGNPDGIMNVRSSLLDLHRDRANWELWTNWISSNLWKHSLPTKPSSPLPISK